MKNTALLKLLLYLVFSVLLLTGCKSSKTGKTLKEAEIKPGISEAEITLAAAEYYKGNFNRAVDIYKEVLRKNPKNRDAELNLMYLAYESGEYRDFYKYADKISKPVSTRDISYLFNDTADSVMLEGRIWEDPRLPVFLSGDAEKYLGSFKIKEKNALTGSRAAAFTKKLSQESLSNITNKIKSERLYFKALAYKDTKNTDKAVNALEEALNTRGYFPSASLLLGQLYFEKGEFALAAKHISTALENDSNQTAGRLTIAKTILAEGRLAEGYAALKRAAAVRPWDMKIKQFLRSFEANNSDIIIAKKAVEKKRRSSVKVPESSVFTPEPELMPQIRVGLAENLRELYIKPGGDFTITNSASELLAKGGKNTILKVRASYRNVFIRKEDGSDLLNYQGTPIIKCKSPSDTILVFNVVHSTGYLSAGKEDRAYRGRISLKPLEGRITVINTLPLEEYLYSVVPSEIPSYWPEEALCAQAVAARSYTLANMGRYKKKGFDVTGSIKSHFYRGFTGENKRTTAAVEKTRGVVLKAEGKYLNAFYSANAAGRTESSQSVWGGKYPLYGVDDPHFSFKSNPPSPRELVCWILSEPESYSSNPKYYYRSSYRWQLLVEADEIEEINRHSVGDIISITTAGRGKSGRVEKILIKGTKGEKIIKGDKIRKSLGGLRSSLFVYMTKLDKKGMPEYFIFAGAGWGHGVGMCQTGAAGMAHEGFLYNEILNHYYPAAELEKIY